MWYFFNYVPAIKGMLMDRIQPKTHGKAVQGLITPGRIFKEIR